LSVFATGSLVCAQLFEQHFATTDEHKVWISPFPERWKLDNLPDDDLIWQVPTFYNNGVAINQSLIQDLIFFFREGETLRKSIASYMWDEEQVQDWAYGTEPSVLLVVGTSQQRKTLDNFGIKVVSTVKPPDVVLYLLNALPDEVADLTTNRIDGILRQLAIQALQALNPMTTPLTLSLLGKVMQLVASDDWLQALAGILALECRVKKDFTIVVDSGVLRNNFLDVYLLPDVFLKLIRQLEGKVKLRVMIIFGRSIVLGFDPAIKTFSVGCHPKRLPPRATRSPVRLGRLVTPFQDTASSPATASNGILNHIAVASASTSEQAIHTISPDNCSGPEESDNRSATALSRLTKVEAKAMDSIDLGAFQASATDPR
jgi:hypothetical protein